MNYLSSLSFHGSFLNSVKVNTGLNLILVFRTGLQQRWFIPAWIVLYVLFKIKKESGRVITLCGCCIAISACLWPCYSECDTNNPSVNSAVGLLFSIIHPFTETGDLIFTSNCLTGSSRDGAFKYSWVLYMQSINKSPDSWLWNQDNDSPTFPEQDKDVLTCHCVHFTVLVTTSW